MRDAENIRAVEQTIHPTWMGFIFYKESPRHVEEVPQYLPQTSQRIGVFVNASFDNIMTHVRQFGLQGVQLHGNVFLEQCQKLREKGLTVVRALPVDEHFPKNALTFQDCVDFFIFDTPTPHYGGSGQSYNWEKLKSYAGHVPFYLSGGIRPADIERLASFHHPRWIGIDLNSGFESAPALKNVKALHDFAEECSKIF